MEKEGVIDGSVPYLITSLLRWSTGARVPCNAGFTKRATVRTRSSWRAKIDDGVVGSEDVRM